MDFSVAAPSAGVLGPFSGGRPHDLAIESKLPPSVSVADVSTVVVWPNSRSRSNPATASGATLIVGGRGGPRPESPVRHTTSRRCASSVSHAPSSRTAVSWTSSNCDSASLRAVATSTSPDFSDPSPAMQAWAASRRVVRVPDNAVGIRSSRPMGRSSMISASPSPASSSRSAISWSTTRPARRAAATTSPEVSSAVATDVTRSTRSCASSTITRSCSGSTW
jgi:hypothetical protein